VRRTGKFTDMKTVGTIVEIRRYPVKSMQGESVTSVALTELGISGDRRYGIRDLESGKILSAKAPKVASALLSCCARTVQRDGADVVLVSAGGVEFELTESRLGVDGLDAALSTLLDRHVRVERATNADEVYESYWPEVEGLALSDVTVDLPIAMSTPKGTFTDLAALHVLALNSLEHLQQLNDQLRLSVDRFRPSITVRASAAEPGVVDGFAEKAWVNKAARIGGATVMFGSESPRCVMTTVAQKELPRELTVLQTIAKHNRVNFGGFGNFACLGIYAEVSAGGTISVGDEIQIEE
jgi:uncharacterized protein